MTLSDRVTIGAEHPLSRPFSLKRELEMWMGLDYFSTAEARHALNPEEVQNDALFSNSAVGHVVALDASTNPRLEAIERFSEVYPWKPCLESRNRARHRIKVDSDRSGTQLLCLNDGCTAPNEGV